VSDLEDLYQELILDHAKRPRNFRDMPDATGFADGHNRLCGDKLRLYVKISDGVIRDIAFKGEGCSISKSSASIMSEMLKGKTLAQAGEIYQKFHHLLTGDQQGEDETDLESLGKLAAFAGVRKFPVRVKCATLAWHTLQAALAHDSQPVSTE
jgi:nitrogen fixation protein NifU and related proteins